MSKKQVWVDEETNRKTYRIPSGASYQLRVRNAVYLNPTNTLRHEISKCIGAYLLKKIGDIPQFNNNVRSLMKYLQKEINELINDFPKQNCDFITEAVAKKEVPERRVDLVRLSDNTRFEFETVHKIKKEDSITIYI